MGQNSVMPQFGGGGCWRVENVKSPFFLSQSIENQKLYNIKKNQSLESIKRENYIKYKKLFLFNVNYLKLKYLKLFKKLWAYTRL